MKTLRVSAFLGAIGLLAFALAACGSDSQVEVAPTPDVAAIIQRTMDAQPQGMTPDDVAQAVQQAMSAQPGVTEDQVAGAIANALAQQQPGVTEGQVASAIANALADQPGVTEDQVTTAIARALAESPGVTEAEVSDAITKALAGRPGVTQEDIQMAVAEAVAMAMPAPANMQGAGDLPVDGVSVLSAALAITQHASALVSTSVRTQRGMTADDLRESAMAVAVRKAALNQEVEILTANIDNDRVLSIKALVDRLLSNAEQINNGRPQLLRALAQGDQTIQQLTVTNSTALFPAAVASVDNQFYRLVSDAQDGGAEEPGDVSRDQVLRYEHVNSLSSNLVLAHTLLLVASRLEDPTFVARSRESYDSVTGRIERDIAYLSGIGDPGLNARLIPLARKMLADGNQDFDRMEQRLGLIVAENALLQNNAKTLEYLMAHLNALAVELQGMDAPPIAVMLDEPTAAPGVADDEIRFGQSAALTGPSSALGIGM